MTIEHAEEDWRKKATDRAASGFLEYMVSHELFDHTWAGAATYIRHGLKLQPNSLILDAGCGWGRVVHALKYHDPSLRIDGIELTLEFVERARRLLSETKLDNDVTISQGNLVEADFGDNKYDRFYSTRVLHYIEEKQTVINKLYRALKPGGRGMIVLPNLYCPYRWFTYKHAPLYPIKSVGEIMRAAGFQKVEYGGHGFLPARPRFRHTSVVCRLDSMLSRTPLNRFAGLAYVVGVK